MLLDLVLLLTTAPSASSSSIPSCDGKISDEMRMIILDFHNEARVSLAKGEEANKTGKLPPAKNMYELSWDCDLEKKAQVAIAMCPENLADLQGYGINFAKRGHCPRNPTTSEQEAIVALIDWWDEARKNGMTDAKNRYITGDSRNIKEWANMANGKNTRIGCSYNKVRGSTVILCAYDDDAAKDERVIYETGNPCKTDEECTSYKDSTCAPSGLCVGTPEPDYKQKQEALEMACSDQTGMTEEIRKYLLNLYNKHRSSVARGLEPDALGGNAPKAKQMLKMVYDCPTEKFAYKLAKHCPHETHKIFSHNWNMYNASSTSMTDEEAADEAISAWWSELKVNGVGIGNRFSLDLFHREFDPKNGEEPKPISHYVAMAKDFSYKLGCVIHRCDEGKYVHCLTGPRGAHPINKPIYEVGEPCKKNSDCQGKFTCMVEEGLCSLF